MRRTPRHVAAVVLAVTAPVLLDLHALGEDRPSAPKPGDATAPVDTETPASTDRQRSDVATLGSRTPSVEIVVTPTRVREDPVNVPQATTTTGRETLERRQPTEAIEAVRDQPGVWVQQTGAGGGTPLVRGLIGNRILYLVDGLRINDGKTFPGPSPFFNQVDVGSVERVEILKGPGAVQYGSDAIGGVVHFRTREVSDLTENEFPNELKAGGDANGHYSSVDRALLGHVDAFVATSRFNALLGGTAALANNYRGGGDEGVLDFTSYKTYGWTAKTAFKLDDGNVLRLGYVENQRSDVDRFDQSQRNQPSGLPRFRSLHERRRFAYVRDELALDSPLVKSVEPYVYYHEAETDSDFTVENATQINRTKTRSDGLHFGAGLQAQSEITKELNLVYGADGRVEVFKERSTLVALTKASGTLARSPAPRSSPEGTYDVTDAFGLFDWRPHERLRLLGGLRFETSHLASEPEPSDVRAGFTINDLTLDKRWYSVTGSVGCLYWALDWLGLSANFASGFRSPTFSDALTNGPFTIGVGVPSPNVRPEQSFGYDVGPRIDLDVVRLQVVWYQTLLRDVIVSAPTGGFVDLNGNGTQDPGEAAYRKDNSGAAWVRGVEAAVELRPFARFTREVAGLGVFGSLTWTESRDQTTGEQLEQTPPIFGQIGVRYAYLDERKDPRTGKPLEVWWVECFTRIVDRFEDVPTSSRTDPAFSQSPQFTFPSATNPPLRSDFSVPGHATVHLRAGWSVNDHATVFVGVDNLLDRRYRVPWSRQDAPGVSVSVGANVKF